MNNKILFSLVLISSNSFSEVHYVTEDGAGLLNGVSIENAFSINQFNNAQNWVTEHKDDNKIGPGDIVYFSGQFNTNLVVKGSGAPGQPIILDGYEDGSYDALSRMPDPSVLATISNPSNGIYIKGHDHLVIQDFHINGDLGDKNTMEGIIIYDDNGDYATHITIKDTYIHHIENRGVYTSKSPNASHGAEFITIGGAIGDGNELYAIGTNTAGYDIKIAWARDTIVSYNRLWAPGSGSKFGNSGISWGDYRDDTQRILIEHNYIANHNSILKAEDGIGGKGGTDIIIRFNYVADHHGEMEGVGIQSCWGDAHRIYTYGNYVVSNQMGIWVTSGSGAEHNSNGVGCRDIYIWGNVISDTHTGDGIRIGGWDGTDLHENIFVYNNTISNNAVNPVNVKTQRDGGYTGIAVVRTSRNINIRNNVLYNNRPHSVDSNQIYIASGLESQTIIENNLFFHENGPATIYWNGVLVSASEIGLLNDIGDPRFKIADKGIYVFGNDSPGLNTGTNLSGLIGSVVVQGVVHDMYWEEGLSFSGANWLRIPPKVMSLKWGKDKRDWDRGAYVQLLTLPKPPTIVSGQ